MDAANPLLDAAPALAAKGCPVLPCWWIRDGRCACGKADCDSPGKHPVGMVVPHGLKDATTDGAVIRDWWTRYPHAHLAMLTGAASGRDALDVDGDEGRASLAALEKQHGPLPTTQEALTGGGGRHVFFAHRPGLRNAVKFLPGLDIRTDGGYVLVEPSGHVSGGTYRWEAAHHPDDTPLAPWPHWLFDLATTAREKEPPAGPVASGGKFAQGTRNAALTSLAGTMRRRGMGRESILAALLAENAARCDPPMAEAEVAGIAESVMRYAAADDVTRARKGKAPKQFHRGDHVEIGKALLRLLGHPDTLLVYDESEVSEYGPGPGLWARIEESTLEVLTQEFAGLPRGKKVLTLKHSDVTGAVKCARARIARREFFANAPPGSAFANGFLAIRPDATIEMEPHGPEHRARSAHPFAFDEQAECPRFLQFLEEVFRDDEDKAQKRLCLEEAGGAALCGLGPRYGKAFMLPGEGANGKSTYMEIVEGVMPPGTTAAVAPQSWTREYHVALLSDKLLNVVAEIPEARLVDSETFKTLVTGEPVTARPIYRPPFTMRSRALHIFAGNRLPQVADLTHGFWRRVMVVAFNRVFAEHEQVPGLARQILAAETPGIVALLVRGARRLVAQKGYTVPSSSLLAKERWKGSADSAVHFVAARTAPAQAGGAWTLSSVLHREYQVWAPRAGYAILPQEEFGKRITAMGVAWRHGEAGTFYAIVLKAEERQGPTAQEVDLWDDPEERAVLQDEARR